MLSTQDLGVEVTVVLSSDSALQGSVERWLTSDVGGRKGSGLTKRARVCRTFASWQENSKTAIQTLDREAHCICSPYTPQYSLNKSIGLYMTTPSSGTVQVFGVLVDPAFLCHQNVSSTETVDEAVQSLWKTVNERVDEDSTSETPHPSVLQVVLGEIGPFTHFKVLTCFHGYQRQI
jgi:hypothetical protein